MQYLATGWATWRLRKSQDETARERAARHLSTRLGRLRGLPQKVGQMLTMSSDEDRNAIFEPLGNQAEPLPFSELSPLLERAWGKPHGQVVKAIDERGLAASLGQVHRAFLHDGREVAVKIQYPGMKQAIETDLDTLGWIAKPVGNLHAGFDMQAYRGTLRQGLEQELDYRIEAKNQRELSLAAEGLALVVPEVVNELSDELVLTTSWEDGDSLAEAEGWPQAEKQRLAQALLEQFLTFAFERGILHSDPHPGNYRFRRSAQGPSVILYDYGCVYRIPERERLLMLRLVASAAALSAQDDPYPLLVELGFDAELLRPLRAKLPAVCRVLFEPFGSQGQFDMSGWNPSGRLEDVLGEDRLNFRIAGPARLLFFLRAYQGLLYYLRRLGEPVLWSGPLRKLLERHGRAARALELAEPVDPSTTFNALAKHLRIEVRQDSALKAQITLPASAVERLEDFLEPEVHERIAARGIHVDEVIRKARRSGYAPSKLFELEESSKSFAVWLE